MSLRFRVGDVISTVFFRNQKRNLNNFDPIFIVPELEPTGIDSITTTVAGTGTGTGTVS